MFYIVLSCLICPLVHGGLRCCKCTCRRSYLSIHLLTKWFYIQDFFGNPTKWEMLSIHCDPVLIRPASISLSIIHTWAEFPSRGKKENSAESSVAFLSVQTGSDFLTNLTSDSICQQSALQPDTRRFSWRPTLFTNVNFCMAQLSKTSCFWFSV